jgi:ABC-type bacteriocin/lantibiotic exporter with double-glycine peptidase domain
MLLASQGFMSVMLYPITKMSDVMQDVFKAHSILERQEEVLDVEVLDDSNQLTPNTHNLTPSMLTGDIELRNVTFGYDRSMPPLIEHLSLHIKPGEKVAFVGKSGCGKSTLAMLVAGLYEPWEGEVLLDGKPIHQTSRATLTSSIGVVGQDVKLFEGTIADNIRMWDESISDEAMVNAANCAQLHDEVTNMPNTYDSMVETGGQNLSSGQRQRLEIAAALAKQPSILIMDEATATLDLTTEAAIIKAVRELGITLLMVAHRLETVRQCDTIYVIAHGKVIQHGTHDSLMSDTKGFYYQLNTYGTDD